MFDASRMSTNLREGGFLAICLLLLYVMVILSTYSEGDPSFSSTATGEGIDNAGGVFGSYLSALLFEIFGRASYLLCLILFVFCWALLLRPAAVDELNHVAWWAAGIGVVLFMISSSSLEYLRFHKSEGLPAGAGGLMGKLIAPVMTEWFGGLGASLLLLCIWLLSWSLAAGLSWFAFLEMVGGALEKIYFFLYRLSHKGKAAEGEEGEMPKRKKKRPAPEIISAIAKKRKRVKEADEKKEPLFGKKEAAAAAAAPAAAESAPAEKKSPGAKPEVVVSLPGLGLLDTPPADTAIDEALLQRTSEQIEATLGDFNIKATVAAVHPGPVITRYDIQPATGVKGAMIVNIARDLARGLSVNSIRVLENIPGTNYIGLEIPNQKRSMVALSEILTSDEYTNTNAALPLALGKTAAGAMALADLAAMPHILIAGATGAGKSVFVNAILLSLLYKRTPAEMRLLLIDPKMLELAAYSDIPHLLAPVVTDMALAPAALHWAVEEMESRYRRMADAGVRHITSYNEAAAAGKITDEEGNPAEPLPYIAVIIDELADLMMTAGKKVEVSISRLAQKARAAGIHIVLATQRPSVDVITGLIKANIPCRLSFQVASKVDSRTILDQMGAEALLGKGDMLYMPSGSGMPQRLHGAFVSDEEVHRVVEEVRQQSGGVHDYLTDFSEVSVGAASGGGVAAGGGAAGDGEGDGESDPLYDQAVEAVVESNRASISMVQRKLRIGYNRAARLVDAMEEAGLVTPMNEFGVRKVIKQ